MSKTMISILNKDMIQSTLKYTDAYLLGIHHFSVNMPFYLEIEEIEEVVSLLKDNGKEVFFNINKNMFKQDLIDLEHLLEKIESLKIDGICFYDISVISIMKKRGFKTPLIWHQEHFTTNYLTIDYWLENGVKMTFLSNEITKEEIEEIKNHTKSKLILQAFGYVPIFLSKRPLVENYKKYFHIKDNSEIYYMEKEHLKYPLRNLDGDFEVYNAKILNALEMVKTLNLDYIYFNSFLIKEDEFINVLICYQEQKLNQISNKYPIELGFLDKKTVYRVKDL